MTQKELNDLRDQAGEEPDLSATENYDGPRDEPAEGSATVEAEHSGTVVYENPSTGEQVMVIPPAGEGQEDA